MADPDPNDTTELQQSFNRRKGFFFVKEVERRVAIANNDSCSDLVPYRFPRGDKEFTMEPEDIVLIKTGARQPPAAAEMLSVISGAAVPKSVYQREYGSTNEEKAIRALYRMWTPYGFASKLTEYSIENGLATVDPPVSDLSGIKHPLNQTAKAITTGMLLRAVFPRPHTLKTRPTDRLKNGERVTAVLEEFSLDLLFPNSSSLRSVFDLGTAHRTQAQKVSDKYEEAPMLEAFRKEYLYNALVAIKLWEVLHGRDTPTHEIERFCGFGHTASPTLATTAHAVRMHNPALANYSSSRLLLHHMLGTGDLGHVCGDTLDRDVQRLNRSGSDERLAYIEATLRHADTWTMGIALSNAEPGAAFDFGCKYNAHGG